MTATATSAAAAPAGTRPGLTTATSIPIANSSAPSMTTLDGPRHHHELAGSTNDLARELAEQGAESGTVVTADEQSAGRGRHGRVWSAPAGAALLCSFILRPLDLSHS